MKLSPLQMAYYRLADFSLTPRSGIDTGEDSFEWIEEMQVYLEVYEEEEEANGEDIATWGVTLGLAFTGQEGDNSPYDFKIALLGTFKCPRTLPSGLEAERLVGVNGSSMLYGVARELIQTISEKSVWGRLTLPTMSFTNYKELIQPDGIFAADSNTRALAG